MSWDFLSACLRHFKQWLHFKERKLEDAPHVALSSSVSCLHHIPQPVSSMDRLIYIHRHPPRNPWKMAVAERVIILSQIVQFKGCELKFFGRVRRNLYVRRFCASVSSNSACRIWFFSSSLQVTSEYSVFNERVYVREDNMRRHSWGIIWNAIGDCSLPLFQIVSLKVLQMAFLLYHKHDDGMGTGDLPSKNEEIWIPCYSTLGSTTNLKGVVNLMTAERIFHPAYSLWQLELCFHWDLCRK